RTRPTRTSSRAPAPSRRRESPTGSSGEREGRPSRAALLAHRSFRLFVEPDAGHVVVLVAVAPGGALRVVLHVGVPDRVAAAVDDRDDEGELLEREALDVLEDLLAPGRVLAHRVLLVDQLVQVGVADLEDLAVAAGLELRGQRRVRGRDRER